MNKYVYSMEAFLVNLDFEALILNTGFSRNYVPPQIYAPGGGVNLKAFSIFRPGA